MRNAQKIIFGIALVIVGIIFALNVLGIFEINIFFPAGGLCLLSFPLLLVCLGNMTGSEVS